MIWIKSFALGVVTMLVGSLATLIAFMIYVGHQIRGDQQKMRGAPQTVGFYPVFLGSHTAMLVCCAWFLAGAGFTYWFIKRRRNRSSISQRFQ